MKWVGIVFVCGILLLGFWLCYNRLFAQDFVDTNQVTVEWDEVLPIDPADIIAYEVFRTPYPFIGDRQDIISLENLGVSMPTQKIITFSIEGEYIIGVRTVRDIKGQGIFKYSDLIWSDIDGIPPFVIRYYITPDSPASIRYL